jgi:uncharacterized protein YdeI (YjbR/CyaY-like superfamily)
MTKTSIDQDPILDFSRQAQWQAWLAKQHKRASGAWLRLYKKASGKATLSYAQAMRAAGLAQVEAAKADGRWAQAYGYSSAAVPADFLKRLAKDKKALAFFKTLNKANTFAIYYRLNGAKKPETRARRLESILAMMAKGEKFH